MRGIPRRSPLRRSALLREKIGEGEPRLGLELLAVLLVRAPLLLLAERLDGELHLAAAGIHLDHLGVDLLADLEGFTQLGSARRACPGGGDVPARVSPGDAQDAHHQTAALDGDDLGLHRFVRLHALRRLVGGIAGGCD
jgi:hypothetical protein